jgi:voltage-gated potassium channel
MVRLIRRNNAYIIFIFALTILSIAIMVASLLPLSEPTLILLRYYDNLMCIIFFLDFLVLLKRAPSKPDYFFHQGGWLDLLGSIPVIGLLRITVLIRVCRLSRLWRIVHDLSGSKPKDIIADLFAYRSQYAGFITILIAIYILVLSSVLELQFESQSPQSSIITGFDAMWYAIVTMTTVGYGDLVPVTTGGRITGMFIMFTGVAIIGALASILASLLMGSTISPEQKLPPTDATRLPVEQELAEIKEELSQLRRLLEAKQENHESR